MSLRLLATSVLFCLLAGVSQPGFAAEAVAPKQEDLSPKQLGERLRKLDRQLDEELDREQLTLRQRELDGLLEQASRCERQAKTVLESLSPALAALPEDAKNDTPDLKKQRESLNKQQKEQTSLGSSCALLQLSARQLGERLVSARRIADEQILLLRTPTLFEGGYFRTGAVKSELEKKPASEAAEAQALAEPPPSWREASRLLWDYPPLDGDWLWSTLGLALALGLLLRLWRRPDKMAPDRSFSRRFFNALYRSAFYHGPLLLMVGAAYAYGRLGFLGSGSEYWMKVLAQTAIAAAVLVIAESLTLCTAPADAGEASRLRAARWSLRFLVLLFLPWQAMGQLIFMALRQEPALSLTLPVAGISLLNCAFYLSAAATAWFAFPLLTTRSLRFIAGLFIVGGALVSIMDMVGYRVLARELMSAQLSTALLLGGAKLLTRFLADFVVSLEGGHNAWQRRLHESLGLRFDENIPGVTPLYITSLVTLWGATLLVLLRLWGLPDETYKKITTGLVDGFTLGAVKIVPESILFGLLVFAALMAGFRWLRRRMEGGWVNENKMSKGGREALATIVWYAGVAVALLVGLSLAGINMSSLAVIAGALSVGIGFGLQNVVSNFISGLILLLERPIRTGDWIVVGATQGYVQKISIRSTRIKTFDRADVIVPNSELITQQVTNWMLNDTYGRVIVPVSVAHGSDIEKVRDVLLGLIEAHGDIVKNDPKVAPPRVLFRGFGELALNFEMRGVIRNVEDSSLVVSDLNFAIDKAFREHGIALPFPQRMVHIRYPEEHPSASAVADDAPREPQ